MGRTLESTILEAIATILLIAAWVIAFTKHEFSGSIATWPWMTIFSTIGIVALLVTVYQRPHKRLDHYEMTNERVLVLSIRRGRRHRVGNVDTV